GVSPGFPMTGFGSSLDPGGAHQTKQTLSPTGGTLMAKADWRLEGEWIKNCSCAFGCPCDFNAKPTNGSCEGLVGMRIAKGHYNNISLDGLSFCVTVAWPGPLHEGNGQAQPIIDERASAEQREALFNIM